MVYKYLYPADHFLRYIVFHGFLIFLAILMCYRPFETVFDIDQN